ncbi:MAG: exopolyphosphatase [Proteobacteria bacterium]|nr:exopolyphosphatase [Desulfobacula sp.]MBU3952820.1 exopolyphosphatase [Pseudomonadota bacterium]MBU4131074.1 exopolyphosphatase [Pseudomonadota bacterium]
MRIVTRPDFDGIVCAVLLHEAETIDSDIYWVEPSDIQNKTAIIKTGDIIANLPYDPRCSLWFDHHVSNQPGKEVKGAFGIAPSAAGVIFHHYRQQGKFAGRFDELIAHTDMIDSADLTKEQVQFPENHPYLLLSMTIQNRGESDHAYWNKLVFMLGKQTIGSILEDPQVQDRCNGVIRENAEFSRFLHSHTTIMENISVTDFRSLDNVPSGNRFLTYSLFPDTIASVKIRYLGPDKSKVLLSIGRSIFNQGCRVNIGNLLARFGGGGHAGAGGCTLETAIAQEKIDQILDIMRANREEK